MKAPQIEFEDTVSMLKRSFERRCKEHPNATDSMVRVSRHHFEFRCDECLAPIGFVIVSGAGAAGVKIEYRGKPVDWAPELKPKNADIS